MENKINIAELLKDCPSGMELDCTMFDTKVIYKGLNKTIPIKTHPIVVQTEHGFEFQLTQYGQIHNIVGSKCVIFPKGKTTWEGFVHPCNFKAGDVLVSEAGNIVLLSHIDSENIVHYHCIIPSYGSFRIEENTSIGVGKYYDCVLANEQQRQRMYDKIKCSGYEYNQQLNKLEKLVKPEFKIGDVIKYNKYPTTDILTIVKIEYDKNRYVVCDKPNSYIFLSFFEQSNYDLIRKTKFDITTLVPFESKVLIRDGNTDKWKPNFWGFYNSEIANNYPYECCGDAYCQCIPYEGNEHLLGKKDDCDEYYKSWE